jgi:hypothetical protein
MRSLSGNSLKDVTDKAEDICCLLEIPDNDWLD